MQKTSKKNAKAKKNKKGGARDGKRLEGFVERYDVEDSLAQANAGVSFGRILRVDLKDADRMSKRLIRGVKGRVSAVHEGADSGVGEERDGRTGQSQDRGEVKISDRGSGRSGGPSAPGRAGKAASAPVKGRKLHMVSVKVYGSDVRALLDTGALPNIMSHRLCEESHLNPSENLRRIKVADRATARVWGELKGVLVTFDTLTANLTFLVVADFPFDLIIGAPNLEVLGARLDMRRPSVTDASYPSAHSWRMKGYL